MTDTQKILEEFEKGAEGKNVHSVYVYCNSCFSWGVNLPLEKECGSCGNTEDTFTYYDAETITLLIDQAQTTLLERVEKEVIGENDATHINGVIVRQNMMLTRNDMRAEQRTKLTQLKEELTKKD